MRQHRLLRIIAKSFFSVATVIGVSYTICQSTAKDWWPFGDSKETTEIAIVVDSAPIPEDIKAVTSIAPMVKKVLPSVVSIYPAKIISSREMRISPFFDDPIFRYFFGDQFEQAPKNKGGGLKQMGLGSGVIVSSNGYILTNNHVVDGADEISVSLPNNKKEYKAEVVGADPKTDIAVIKIDGDDFPSIRITNSDHLEVGDFVAAIGNPFGVGQTVTSGIVSAVSRGNIGITDYEDFIQTDASINPGNSGGALVDAQGRLIGINTAILSRTGGNQGIGFAVPINLAMSIMNQILKHGRVVRGFLGVQIQEVTPDLAKAFQLSNQEGALVGDVIEDGAAEEAGILKGDVIIEFNGRRVKDVRHLRLMVARTPPGAAVTVTLVRDGKIKNVEATLKELPGSEITTGMRPPGTADGDDVLKGVVIDDLNPRTRQQIGAPTDLRGAYVVEVDPASPAASAGLQAGDVILEINRNEVRNANEAIARSQDIDGNTVLLYVWGNGGRRYVVVKREN